MEPAELRIKYLEMIQAIVIRLAGQSATLKNYCITLTVGIVGFGVNQHKPTFAWAAVVAIIIMGALDAQYLRTERRVRALYDKVRLDSWGEIPTFELDVRKSSKVKYLAALTSWSIWQFYGPLLGGVVLAITI